MPSVFTKIISRELPAYIVAEDENNMAILDINPLVYGHVLVFSKIEVDLIFDLHSDHYSSLMAFTKKIGSQMKVAFPSKRIAMSVVGLEVPHAHVHLIPISSVNELNFSNERCTFTKEEWSRCLQQLTCA
ncbi:MAG: HIT family protein [Flavobacteriia bacterium]|nr:HIT family protein [Flavobacteriia bacterium]